MSLISSTPRRDLSESEAQSNENISDQFASQKRHTQLFESQLEPSAHGALGELADHVPVTMPSSQAGAFLSYGQVNINDGSGSNDIYKQQEVGHPLRSEVREPGQPTFFSSDRPAHLSLQSLQLEPFYEHLAQRPAAPDTLTHSGFDGLTEAMHSQAPTRSDSNGYINVSQAFRGAYHGGFNDTTQAIFYPTENENQPALSYGIAADTQGRVNGGNLQVVNQTLETDMMGNYLELGGYYDVSQAIQPLLHGFSDANMAMQDTWYS